MKNNEKIKFVGFYDEAPADARFILRRILPGNWILQEYCDNTQFNLIEFPLKYDNINGFNFILTECIKLIGDDSTLWVEKPSWMCTEEEFISLVKKFEEIYE